MGDAFPPLLSLLPLLSPCPYPGCSPPWPPRGRQAVPLLLYPTLRRLTRYLARYCTRMASAPSNMPASPTRAENKGPADPAQPPPPSSQHEHVRLFSDAAVEVRWADPTSGPTSANLRLFVVHTADLSQAFVQLQARNVELRNEPNKKTFYLNLPVERIARLILANTMHWESFGAQAYRLDITLDAPLDLVGPPTPGCAAGWPEAKGKGKRLLSLQRSRFYYLHVHGLVDPGESLVLLSGRVDAGGPAVHCGPLRHEEAVQRFRRPPVYIRLFAGWRGHGAPVPVCTVRGFDCFGSDAARL